MSQLFFIVIETVGFDTTHQPAPWHIAFDQIPNNWKRKMERLQSTNKPWPLTQIFPEATTVSQSNISGVKYLIFPATTTPTTDAWTKLDQVKLLLLFPVDGVAATKIKCLIKAAQTMLDQVKQLMLFAEYGVAATTPTIDTQTKLDGIKRLP